MSQNPPKRAKDLADLVALVRRLRAPDGCPWDRKQTMSSIRAYLIEEAHELAAAIDAEDFDQILEELGDLLFQTAFIACLAEEASRFDVEGAVQGIYDKMVERHPHVFPPPGSENEPVPETVDQVLAAWEARKAKERDDRSILAGVPPSLPALTGAYRLTQKAAGVGFDWPDAAGPAAKVREELEEVERAVAAGDLEGAREEVGDLLFAVANLSRKLKLDPESALARGNLKFRRRFEALEDVFRERREPLSDADLESMDAVWEEIKKRERRKS